MARPLADPVRRFVRRGVLVRFDSVGGGGGGDEMEAIATVDLFHSPRARRSFYYCALFFRFVPNQREPFHRLQNCRNSGELR